MMQNTAVDEASPRVAKKRSRSGWYGYASSLLETWLTNTVPTASAAGLAGANAMEADLGAIIAPCAGTLAAGGLRLPSMPPG